MRQAPLEAVGLLLRRVQGSGHMSMSLWEQTWENAEGQLWGWWGRLPQSPVAGRPGQQPYTRHAAGDGPQGPQLEKPVPWPLTTSPNSLHGPAEPTLPRNRAKPSTGVSSIRLT